MLTDTILDRQLTLELARFDADRVVRTTLLEGVVGEVQPSELGALLHGPSIRFDCFANMEFWMEYDVSTGAVRGRVPTALLQDENGRVRLDGEFRVARSAAHPNALRFTHTRAPAFWVELAY